MVMLINLMLMFSFYFILDGWKEAMVIPDTLAVW